LTRTQQLQNGSRQSQLLSSLSAWLVVLASLYVMSIPSLLLRPDGQIMHSRMSVQHPNLNEPGNNYIPWRSNYAARAGHSGDSRATTAPSYSITLNGTKVAFAKLSNPSLSGTRNVRPKIVE